MRQSISVTVLFACLFTLVPSAHAQAVNETQFAEHSSEAGLAGRIIASTPYLETTQVIVNLVEDHREIHAATFRPRGREFQTDKVPAGAVCNVQVYSHFYQQTQKVKRIPAGTRDLVLQLPELRTVSGVVTDAETGEPVTEFTVQAHVMDERYPDQYKHEDHAITSPDGTFRIPVPVTDKCLIAINSPNHIVAWSDPFAVEPGADPEPLAFALDRGYSVRGRVVDSRTGEGIEGIRVTAPGYERTNRLMEIARVTTDASGQFVLHGLEAAIHLLLLRDPASVDDRRYLPDRIEDVQVPGVTDLGTVEMSVGGGVEGVVRFEDGTPVTQGHFHVQVHHRHMPTRSHTSTSAAGYYSLGKLPEGSHPARLSIAIPEQMQSRVHVWSGTVTIETGRMNRLDITLPPGRNFIGTVTQGGEPLESGSISLVQAEGWGQSQVRQWGGAIRDGRFHFRAVDTGSFAVMAQGNETSFGNVGRVTIKEPRGEEELHVDVDVLPVRGRVLDATGNPVADAAGFIYPAGLAGEELWTWQFTNNWTADDSGAFSTFVPGPGHYVLSPQMGQRENFRPQKLRVPVGGQEGVLLRQEKEEYRGSPNHYIAGRVTDASGHPVQNVVVSATSLQAHRRAWTEPDVHGEFQFERLYPGTYRVEAKPDYYRRVTGLSAVA